jgi:hypothetical protein
VSKKHSLNYGGAPRTLRMWRETMPEPFVRELRDLAVARLRAGRRKETFTDTLRLAAERLAPVLPAAAGRADELPTQLRVFHPRP